MNEKKVKQLRKRARVLLIELFRSFLPDDVEATDSEVIATIPPQKYTKHLGQTKLSMYSERWLCQRLKKDPNVTVDELKPK